MRLPESQIKQAILHPENEASYAALKYFTESFSLDPAIMPLVIQAIEQNGRHLAYQLIGSGKKMIQNDDTIQWIIAELDRPFDTADFYQTGYFTTLVKVLYYADASLLLRYESQIAACATLSEQARNEINERLRILSCDGETCWKEVEDFCEKGADKLHVTELNLMHAGYLIERIAREKEKFSERVLALLAEEVDDYDDDPMYWMEPLMVQLAGEMRLEAAIPLLVEKLHIDADYLNDQTIFALTKIGTDAVVDAVCAPFASAEWGYRLYAVHPIEHIHTDLAVAKCLALLSTEKDETIKTNLASGLLSHFAYEGIAPVRELILSGQWDPQMADLREELVTACTIMGERFPEYEQWKEETDKARAEQQRRIAAMDWDNLEDLFAYHDPEDEAEEDWSWDEEWNDDDEMMKPAPAKSLKIGRNDPCPCGSGKKYKKCCLARDEKRA